MELPVITTKVTGCIDSIIENKTGFFVEHTVCELANVIERLYISKDKCCALGTQGRQFVVDNFEEKIIWEEIEKLYNG